MLFLSTCYSLWSRITRRLLVTLYLFSLVNTGYAMIAGSLPSASTIAGYNQTLDFNRKQAILTRSGFTQILYNYIDSNVNQLYHQQVTAKCVDSLINLNRSLENGDPWAFKMLDASGRAPIDLTGIGYVDMGNFDQCLQLNWINVSGFKEVGQHCLTSVIPNPPNPGTVADLFTSRKILIDYDEGYSMRIGFCIPSSCSQNDLQIILNKALEPFSWSVLRVDSCQISKSFNEKFWTAPNFQKISFLVLSVFISLVIYATWRDIFIFSNVNTEKKRKPQSIDENDHWIRSFSILTNWKNLTQPDKEMSRCPLLSKCALIQHFVVLHFHAAIWPIITNAMTIYAIGNPIVKHRESQLVRNLFGEWFMDGLFAYAGTTRALELWKKITPETSFWRIFIIIIRKMLILNILFCILIMVETVIPLFSYGPFNPLIAERRAEICARTYMANLLFYQNYVGSLDKVCIAHSWSLAAEYQLVLFLAGLVWLYKRSPKIALTLNSFAITGGLIHVGRVFYDNNLSPHPLARGFHPSIVSKWTELVYLPSEMHLWLYLATPMWIYFTMNPSSFKFSKFFADNHAKIRQGLFFYGFVMLLYPYIWTSISAYESPLLIGIYIVIYRVFTGLFYTIIALNNGEELREYFSSESKKSTDSINNNGSISYNGNAAHIEAMNTKGLMNRHHVDQSSSQLHSNKSKKYLLEAKQYKMVHIATIIFRSTYCIHIPVLIWYYSQHKWPVLTTEEWGLHLFSTVFLSIVSGFVFYLFILGPFYNLTEAIKPKVKQDNEQKLQGK